MRDGSLTDWPIWYDERRRDAANSATTRHDIELVRYLEKKEAHRARSARSPDLVSAGARLALAKRLLGMINSSDNSAVICLRMILSVCSRQTRSWSG